MLFSLQFPFAVAIGASALLSATVYFLSHTRQLKTELPLPNNGLASEDIEVLVEKVDVFDVTKPEDMIDGFPIDEDRFWAKIRVIKLASTAVFVLLVAVESVVLGFAASTEFGDSALNIAAVAIHLAFALYLLILCIFWIPLDDVPSHWATTIHLSALTSLATFLLAISALLPSSAAIQSGPEPSVSPLLSALFYTELGLLFVAATISSTLPRGPPLHFPANRVYSAKTLATSTPLQKDNVCGVAQSSVVGFLLFSYTTPVVFLGYTAESLEIRDLPIVPADMRATTLYALMRYTMRHVKLRGRWRTAPGTGWDLMWKVLRVNSVPLTIQIVLAGTTAVLYYVPAYFLQQLVLYLENDPNRENMAWGWVYCAGLFFSHAIDHILTGQLWSISTTTLQVRMRVQLNTTLFAKTLVRKDVASSSSSASDQPTADADGQTNKDKKDDEDDFSSKAQIMTLMTTDVDRVSEFSWHFFSLIDAPVEIVIGSIFLYRLLGVSSLLGLAVSILFLPLSHFASKYVVYAQDNLMKARDERVALMNELLGAIRMLKFMAWERSYEKRVMTIREKELHFQRLNYIIEIFFTAIWLLSPIVVTLVSFFHFTVIRGQILTPSTAFTSVAVFNELRFALSALPETFINMMQSLVSVRRIEKYLCSAEISPALPLAEQGDHPVSFNSATVTWPQDRISNNSLAPSIAPTPRGKFVLIDLTLRFPTGELSLICGKLGSGKTLLLLGLLGEADVLAGQVICPRTPPDALAGFSEETKTLTKDWIVPGIVAYVPQSAWLQNASIKENILFSLPYDEARYRTTLEICALVADLEILEDGDDAEIGERGVNLSGGQKARISLARAVYSRASILLLDDVLSAVDAHTAQHLYERCLKGDLLRGRTVILVSHHVQLCLPGASYVVALDNGRLQYTGDSKGFGDSAVIGGLIQSGSESTDKKEEPKGETIEEVEAKIAEEEPAVESGETNSDSGSSTAVPSSTSQAKLVKKAPRKLVEEERRAVGRIGRQIWALYIRACGGYMYWSIFALFLALGAIVPVMENGWLRFWSGAVEHGDSSRAPIFYVGIYAVICLVGLTLQTIRLYVLYEGAIHASTVLYKRLLEAVLFAKIRFHDTVSRGRLLNRFGKDFEGLDSSLADNFGRTIIYGINVLTTFVTVTYVGGPAFFVAAVVLGVLYYNVAKVYGQTSRDMRRLDSVTKSPLYTIYGESISGVGVLRAFGASTKFLKEMIQHVDTNTNPYYWMWSVNRWLSARFNLLSAAVVGVTAIVILLKASVDASFAGFALAFAVTVTNDLLFMVRRFVGLEQSMVALERVNEFSEIEREAPEFVEPRPPASWPEKGDIDVENLVIRYAPDLPNVLHGLTFSIKAESKIGILGRTGCGKSTLALSFFRFVEATEGSISVDGIDISKIGLTDLRSKLTIIPQDPTIFSGTLRSTLDVFEEYEDHEIFEALRRVHLLPSEDAPPEEESEVNDNVFRSLDSPVSEGGENFSAGEKQLICMARAILRRSKVLLMDEATASVDYATDELISKTIREEFAHSTILTIAHRLRTVIDYDKVMLLDQGHIVEFDSPHALLSDPSSNFYSLCQSTGKAEFATLKRLAAGGAALREAQRS